MIRAHRYHDFSAGHRVVGHESKCRNLHGHNYRVTFHCESPELDDVGRVTDFSVIKSSLCQWVEDNWDHMMMIWWEDPKLLDLQKVDPAGIVGVPFNPTAENMAWYLVTVVGPERLPLDVTLVECEVMETRKCGATFRLSQIRVRQVEKPSFVFDEEGQ